MNQLTIRGFDGELWRRLTVVAEREGLSLNQAALKLMRTGAGLETTSSSYAIGSRITKYAGVWDESEARQFDRDTQAFSELDPEMWQ
jgi:hypothetical protein